MSKMSEAIYDVSNATRMPSVCGSSCMKLYTSKLEKTQTSNFFFVSNPIEFQTFIPCIFLFADLDCFYKGIIDINDMEVNIDFSMLPLVWGIQWTELFNELMDYMILVNIIQLKVIAIFF